MRWYNVASGVDQQNRWDILGALQLSKKKDEIPEKPANNATKRELWEHVDKLENYIGNLREQLGLITKDQINRTAKNDVFVHLFSLPEYQLKLYQELFPTDTSVTADDIELITLKELMANHPYNDLGLLVRNVLILLLEAQSTWSINIAVRLAQYYFQTLQTYANLINVDFYRSTKVPIPKVAAFVLYTGPEKVKDDEISLRKVFFDDDPKQPDFTVMVLRSITAGGILDQYVNFCKTFDAQRQQYPDDAAKCISETLQICSSNNWLKDYLKKYGAEVEQIMQAILSITRDPKEVRRGEAEHSAILGAIQLGRAFNISDDQIAELLTKQYHMIPQYAKNYIEEYDRELENHILPWETA